MTYRIQFNPVTAQGIRKQSLAVTVGPFHPENPCEKVICIGLPALERLCVEYARIRGIPCSYAEIFQFDEVTA